MKDCDRWEGIEIAARDEIERALPDRREVGAANLSRLVAGRSCRWHAVSASK